MSSLKRPAEFDHDRFISPKAIDRGAPFWSWNGTLDLERLLHQLDVFEQMGMGGAHAHPRSGLATEYLGEDFFDHMEACVEHAKKNKQLIWLYDEDRWPSGFAGGKVTADHRLRIRHLRFTTTPINEGEIRRIPVHHGPPQEVDPEDRLFVAAWALVFEKERLVSYRFIEVGQQLEPHETPLYAYREIAPDWTWFNHQQYVDTLNPEAMRRFIEVTHEQYYERFKDEFGSTIPAIFTDEPLFTNMQIPEGPTLKEDVFLSWTDDLAATYQQVYDEDLLEILPAVLFTCEDGHHRRSRWRFHQHHTQRFVEAFAAQLGGWCGDHGLALTGHMMAEESLQSQTKWVGEVMRSLRHFQLPGIDLLCDKYAPTTAKQAQSIARQCQRAGVMSELYGVTNWDFRFTDHKRQGDWQAALGINVRVHHLTWYQMGGEAKRDYPASIGEHSPWWSRYRLIEDHFARVNVTLSAGVPHCKVAMIHPIESMWLVYGPKVEAQERRWLEEGFSQTLSWILDDLIDVDLVSEEVLAELEGADEKNGFRVGAMRYEVVVVPPTLTLRRHTVERLAQFAERGGKVLVLDTTPQWVDADQCLNDELDGAEIIAWDRARLMSHLEPYRELRLILPDGHTLPALHQMRVLPDGERLLFLCRTEKHHDANYARLEMKGEWQVFELDTATGQEKPMAADYSDGNTLLDIALPVAAHLLLRLSPGRSCIPKDRVLQAIEVGRLPDPCRVELEEDNVLLLDRAAWRLDEGSWHEVDDVLRIANYVREALGFLPCDGNQAQPWVCQSENSNHQVTLAYDIEVTHKTGPVKLALEQAHDATVVLDGEKIEIQWAGKWVDVAFQALHLPALSVGLHRLEITWPFNEVQGLEACYLLGDFGVKIAGQHAWIDAPVRKLSWGDVTNQGLPFYGGTIHYDVDADLPASARIAIKHTKAPVLDVEIQGKTQAIWRSPWSADFSNLEGKTSVRISCYGNRYNCFGQLHNVKEHHQWWGPASWRTTGEDWSDAWHPRPAGIQVAPRVFKMQ